MTSEPQEDEELLDSEGKGFRADDVYRVLNEFQNGLEEAQPIGKMPEAKGAPAEAKEPGFSFLQSFLRRTLFFDYFVHISNHVYAGVKQEQRVGRLKKHHRLFYGTVIVLDLLLRLITTLGLIGAAFWAVVKTLS